jgi:hypothetical protein
MIHFKSTNLIWGGEPTCCPAPSRGGGCLVIHSLKHILFIEVNEAKTGHRLDDCTVITIHVDIQ